MKSKKKCESCETKDNHIEFMHENLRNIFNRIFWVSRKVEEYIENKELDLK